MLSLATVSAVVIPLADVLGEYMIVVLLGAGIGSLIPDVDAEDAAVFHRNIRGINGDVGKFINFSIGSFLPYFGYTTKYLIYKPAVKTFNLITPKKYSFQEKHRSFTHSILGVLTMTAVTGIYLSILMTMAGITASVTLLIFLTAYMTGALLHMLQDSCTKTGIAWNSPFSRTKLKGQLKTGKDMKAPRYFLYWLIVLNFASLYTTSYYSLTVIQSGVLSTAILGASWMIFVKIIAEARLK